MHALALHQTTVGKKVIIAITGVIMFGFLIGHTLGNLQIFMGPEKINAYSEFLHHTASLLWGTRVVLLGAISLHIYFSMSLARQNSAARPIAYKARKDQATNYAARTMVWSGPIIAAFIVYHLAHLTAHVTPNYTMSETNVYDNLVYGFQIPWLASFYIFCQLLLGTHLFHGVWSFMQSLGINHPRYNNLRRIIAAAVTGIIVVGNISIPLAIMAGVVKPSAELVRADDPTAGPHDQLGRETME
ncbi:MAG: succinate dehydrogenase cytochrome b subunit [Sandaracinaceae bacterium]|nr:succinate dehydrogenase cytochrome b subunit [Sandaracinaceae bacterium]